MVPWLYLPARRLSLMTEFLFLSLYGFAAAYCGWCLCIAAKGPMPKPTKCSDEIFERVAECKDAGAGKLKP